MTRMPRITGKKLVAVLKRNGVVTVRITGSHHHLHRPGGRLVTVPVHSGEIIIPSILKSILKQAEITVEELIDLL
jgi:predicted RNA binding protein YcfA (HicA-like mRNA interferase family)